MEFFRFLAQGAALYGFVMFLKEYCGQVIMAIIGLIVLWYASIFGYHLWQSSNHFGPKYLPVVSYDPQSKILEVQNNTGHLLKGVEYTVPIYECKDLPGDLHTMKEINDADCATYHTKSGFSVKISLDSGMGTFEQGTTIKLYPSNYSDNVSDGDLDPGYHVVFTYPKFSDVTEGD